MGASLTSLCEKPATIKLPTGSTKETLGIDQTDSFDKEKNNGVRVKKRQSRKKENVVGRRGQVTLNDMRFMNM